MTQWHHRVSTDLARSQEFFRRVLGRPVTAFSYPHGEAGYTGNTPEIVGRLRELLGQAGFNVAFLGENVPTGHIETVGSSSPRWLLPRIGVRSTTSTPGLLAMLRRAVPTSPPRDLTTLPWRGELATCARGGPAGSPSLVLTGRRYGSCVLDNVNTSRWFGYAVRTQVSGVSRHAAAVIAVRDGSGTGHRGRLEVVLGESTLVVREQIGDAPRTVLATARLPRLSTTETGGAPGARLVQIRVRSTSAVISVAGETRPLVVPVDRRLREGGVMFSLVTTTPHTITFGTPTLTPI